MFEPIVPPITLMISSEFYIDRGLKAYLVISKSMRRSGCWQAISNYNNL